ncbi:hypothetical protein JRQ81_001388 [Phrynocephalus forsythii]|uniref:Immunoglobulin domain-containing protein n=1 Tax=Phrynocephalus forsythii TaxID=171643 RepID=A0A9Q1B7U1_9SAUR|nr:hypothetical protein JRQ81_001388 [Phrynocephalus forsythii]
MEVTQPTFLVARSQDPVNFICEYNHAKDVKELRVTLLKETGNTSVQICASPIPIQHDKPLSLKDRLHCQVSPGFESVNLTLRGLQSTDAGVYICKIERLYPPPYYPVMGNGTQLYVVGELRNLVGCLRRLDPKDAYMLNLSLNYITCKPATSDSPIAQSSPM